MNPDYPTTPSADTIAARELLAARREWIAGTRVQAFDGRTGTVVAKDGSTVYRGVATRNLFVRVRWDRQQTDDILGASPESLTRVVPEPEYGPSSADMLAAQRVFARELQAAFDKGFIAGAAKVKDNEYTKGYADGIRAARQALVAVEPPA